MGTLHIVCGYSFGRFINEQLETLFGNLKIPLKENSLSSIGRYILSIQTISVLLNLHFNSAKKYNISLIYYNPHLGTNLRNLNSWVNQMANVSSANEPD